MCVIRYLTVGEAGLASQLAISGQSWELYENYLILGTDLCQWMENAPDSWILE